MQRKDFRKIHLVTWLGSFSCGKMYGNWISGRWIGPTLADPWLLLHKIQTNQFWRSSNKHSVKTWIMPKYLWMEFCEESDKLCQQGSPSAVTTIWLLFTKSNVWSSQLLIILNITYKWQIIVYNFIRVISVHNYKYI